MNEFLKMCLIICPLVFTAGFVDAIAGGGGVISLPAYLLAGLPVHTAMGTNKMANGMGSLVSSIQYIFKKKVDLSVAAIAAIGSLLGGYLGSSIALLIPENVLKIVMLVVLPCVAVFLFLKKDFGTHQTAERQLAPLNKALLSFAIGIAIGGYDGLIGPGTGTFFILAFTGILGFDLLKSSGCAKVANLASNLASFIAFIINGKVLISIAIPAAICAMAGNFIGSRLAIKKGAGFIRYIMFVVLGLLIIKMVYDLLN